MILYLGDECGSRNFRQKNLLIKGVEYGIQNKARAPSRPRERG